MPTPVITKPQKVLHIPRANEHRTLKKAVLIAGALIGAAVVTHLVTRKGNP